VDIGRLSGRPLRERKSFKGHYYRSDNAATITKRQRRDPIVEALATLISKTVI